VFHAPCFNYTPAFALQQQQQQQQQNTEDFLNGNRKVLGAVQSVGLACFFTGCLNWPVDFNALDEHAFLFQCATISANALRLEGSQVPPVYLVRAYGGLVD
jgi:hypothetical protein